MKKVEAFQASDGQLFTDRKMLVEHELELIVAAPSGAAPSEQAIRSTVVNVIIEKRDSIIEILSLLRVRGKAKSKKTVARENELAGKPLAPKP